ncbi:GAK system CofD-like protein [Desulfovibrio aerotolerans]|uniref:GAK system CofD-like protein n=1 Tax=Solidesulfovibrio aerotolerans TaxID=295255 RepID=A0A7C9N0B8_9BACT|nr:GAK system CofD-like protein [Solidesulfovibrio aerotolerans]
MPQSKSYPRVAITRTVRLPDPSRAALYRRAPELGPKILFFSGGTALRHLSETLIEYTSNSIHLITPFDSGGSSAVLRRAFAMPAVGDLRNRIMALADRSITGNPAVFELFAFRLPKDASQEELALRLSRLISGDDPLIRRVPDPLRKIIRTHLRFFEERRPASFDLRGASIGNCILTGGYFNYNRMLDPVIYLFMQLVEARGVVRPIVNADLHLACELADGRVLMGQHRMTGKEGAPIDSPIARLWLTADLEDPSPVTVRIRDKTDKLIRQADVICFPYGSFYSSLLANLLPQGVGDAIVAAGCPKIYIPNLGHDPEQCGLTVAGQTARLLAALETGCVRSCRREDLLRFVAVDSRGGRYDAPLDLTALRRLGVEVLDVPLARDDNPAQADSRKVAELLLSLA